MQIPKKKKTETGYLVHYIYVKFKWKKNNTFILYFLEFFLSGPLEGKVNACERPKNK